MKESERQFSVLAQLAWLLVICVFCMGLLVIYQNVTANNSFGIDGIINTLKDATMLVLGFLGGLAKQQHDASSTNNVGEVK